jgi:tyrosyl-tRNA synthetase
MKVSTDAAKIEKLLTHQVEEVIVRESLEKKLKSGKQLRVKFGADPSRPDLHIGHAVVLRKLREFQDLGHMVIFLIGDFTALIGDPSGKSKTRPMLSEKEIKANAKTYLKQVGLVLDTKKCEIRFNSEWLGSMKAAEFVKLTAQFTAARVLERDDFSKRWKEHADIHMHELLYPMLQAQDSIALEADVEIGATDQKFNLLTGRDLQRKLAMAEQDVLTSPILVGTDGAQKMSKSLDNYIGLTDSADEMYGKTMSIPDSALPNWIDLAADYSKEEIEFEKGKLAKGWNPRDIKAELAKRIVKMWHGEKAATAAAENFVARFKKGEMPTEMPEFKWKMSKPTAGPVVAHVFGLSNTQARRDMEAGGVKINGKAVKDWNEVIEITKEGTTIQKGKLHFAKVKLK